MRKPNLTRKDLAKAINQKLGFSQRSSALLVDEIFSCLKKSILAGESIKLVQFGTFSVKNKASRMGRNPQTGESLEITERQVVTFKASKILRQWINNHERG